MPVAELSSRNDNVFPCDSYQIDIKRPRNGTLFFGSLCHASRQRSGDKVLIDGEADLKQIWESKMADALKERHHAKTTSMKQPMTFQDAMDGDQETTDGIHDAARYNPTADGVPSDCPVADGARETADGRS